MKKIICLLCLLAMLPFVANAIGRNIQDNFKLVYNVIDLSGDHVSGETVTVAIQRASDSYWFDFNDSTFKTSGWTNKTTNLSEDSTNGFYHYTYNPPASETGAEEYVFIVDSASAIYGDHQNLVVCYQDIGSGDTPPTVASIADAVWEEAIADHSGTAGSTAEKLNAAAVAGDPWATNLPGSYTGIQAGKIIGDKLDAKISTRATPSDVTVYVGQ